MPRCSLFNPKSSTPKSAQLPLERADLLGRRLDCNGRTPEDLFGAQSVWDDPWWRA